jgi:hypothetical protein
MGLPVAFMATVSDSPSTPTAVDDGGGANSGTSEIGCRREWENYYTNKLSRTFFSGPYRRHGRFDWVISFQI